MTPSKNTVCLWYDNDAEEAARFYASTFADSAVGAIHRARVTIPQARRAMCWWSNSPCWACPAWG